MYWNLYSGVMQEFIHSPPARQCQSWALHTPCEPLKDQQHFTSGLWDGSVCPQTRLRAFSRVSQ